MWRYWSPLFDRSRVTMPLMPDRLVHLAGATVALLLVGGLLGACATGAPASALQAIAPTPSPTVNIQASVVAGIQATRAAEPTATASPTATATATPEPTATLSPTATPEPTETPVPPTATPAPPTATSAPKATSTPAINPAERAYVDAWTAIREEYNASVSRANRGGQRTGVPAADAMTARDARIKEYHLWLTLNDRVTALTAPPRLQPAHALRVEAFGYLVKRANLLNALEGMAPGQAPFLDAQAHNLDNQFVDTIAKAAAESKKVGW
jgi:hypothetical protein